MVEQETAAAADSTAAAEIIAANVATKEGIWMSRLLADTLGTKQIPLTTFTQAKPLSPSASPEVQTTEKIKPHNPEVQLVENLGRRNQIPFHAGMRCVGRYTRVLRP